MTPMANHKTAMQEKTQYWIGVFKNGFILKSSAFNALNLHGCNVKSICYLMENQTEQNASKTTVPSNCFEQPGEQVNLVLEHEQIEDAVEPEIQMAVKPRRTNRTKTGKSKIMNNNGVQPKTTVNLFTTPSVTIAEDQNNVCEGTAIKDFLMLLLPCTAQMMRRPSLLFAKSISV